MWLDEWRTMAILAVAIVAGSLGAAYAYQNAPAARIAVFDLSYVAFAVVWGFTLFAEVPAPSVAAGIGLIVTAGVLATRRKQPE